MLFTSIRKFFGHPCRLATLNGHKGPVVTIHISPKGDLLASGGDDGVKIWDLKTMAELPVPEQAANEKAQISCVRWITRKNEPFNMLVYGNALGFLVFLQQRPTKNCFESILSVRIACGGEILAITSDVSETSITRIATGTRDRCVQVWTFDALNRTLKPVHSKAYGNDTDIIPKELAFDSNKDHDLYVFGLYDGGLYKYGGQTGERLVKHQLGSPVGNAAVDMERKICVIDNAGNGFDLYSMDTGSFVKTFATREPLKTYPRSVAFANDSHAVVGGSDHGKVYIFERKNGKMITTLTHAKVGGVETLAVHDGEDGSVVLATASSTTAGPCPIRIWKWLPKPGDKASNSDRVQPTIMKGLELLLRLGMVLATVAYLVGVVRDLVKPKDYSSDTLS